MIHDSKTYNPAQFTDNRRKISLTTKAPSLPREFLAQLISHQRRTVEALLLKVLFLENHSHKVKALKQFSPVSPSDLAVKSFKQPFKPALELLGKDMRDFLTMNSEVCKQSITVGSGTEHISLCRCFSLRVAYLSTMKYAELSSPIAILILT